MNAFRVAGDSVQVSALVMPDASMVCGRAETIAHQLPSVTTPIRTSVVRSSSSIRSIGLAAQPSASGSRSESTGSMTSTSAPIMSPVDERASRAHGDRAVGRADLRGECLGGCRVALRLQSAAVT